MPMLDGLGNALAHGATPQLEAAFLGVLLSRVSLLAAVPSGFLADHLGVEGYPEIFRAIRAVAETQARGPVALPVMKLLGNELGIREVVSELIGAAVSFLPDTVTSYGDAITDLYRRRRLLDLAGEIQGAVIGDRTVPTDHLRGVRDALQRRSEESHGGGQGGR